MSNSKPIDTLNEQMNLLVESQAQEIKELKQENDKLTEFTNNLTGSPNSAEEIIDYINSVNHEVLELKEENKEPCDCPKDKDGECIPMTELEKLKIGHKVMSNSYKLQIEKLKNDLRLCADGLIPHGMVGGIVETERELRHKAEEENKELKLEIRYLNSGYGVCGMGSGQTHVGGDFQED
jgi:hypothetical protein